MKNRQISIYKTIKKRFSEIINGKGLASEVVRVRAKTLTPKEAIGNAEDNDYPLQKGREFLVQADFKGSVGQAFTDMAGNYEGSLHQIVGMNLTNNLRRAVFISTLNAVMRHFGMVDGTRHCKDKGPIDCSRELVNYLKENFGKPKIALVGLQPRMLEALSSQFKVKVTDLDENNIGKKKYGITIDPPQRTEVNLNWCDVAVVTGTTLVNGTIVEFVSKQHVIFYGVSIAGSANLLGLTHFCPYST